MTRGRFQLGLDAGPLPVKPERIAQGAARHPEVQGCESKHFILQLDMSLDIVQRQVFVVQYFIALELYIGIHGAPGLGADACYRQSLTGRLAMLDRKSTRLNSSH